MFFFIIFNLLFTFTSIMRLSDFFPSASATSTRLSSFMTILFLIVKFLEIPERKHKGKSFKTTIFGGFVRDIIAGCVPSDVDLFLCPNGSSKLMSLTDFQYLFGGLLEWLKEELKEDSRYVLITTAYDFKKNCRTVLRDSYGHFKITIHDNVLDVDLNFDFCAVIAEKPALFENLCDLTVNNLCCAVFTHPESGIVFDDLKLRVPHLKIFPSVVCDVEDIISHCRSKVLYDYDLTSVLPDFISGFFVKPDDEAQEAELKRQNQVLLNRRASLLERRVGWRYG
jgi:hypothetical protein